MQVKSDVSKDMKEIFDEDDDYLDENVEQSKEDLDGIDEFFDDSDNDGEEIYEASLVKTSNSLDPSTSGSEMTMTLEEKASPFELVEEAEAAIEQGELAKEDGSIKSLESETEEQESHATMDDKENVKNQDKVTPTVVASLDKKVETGFRTNAGMKSDSEIENEQEKKDKTLEIATGREEEQNMGDEAGEESVSVKTEQDEQAAIGVGQEGGLPAGWGIQEGGLLSPCGRKFPTRVAAFQWLAGQNSPDMVAMFDTLVCEGFQVRSWCNVI